MADVDHYVAVRQATDPDEDLEYYLEKRRYEKRGWTDLDYRDWCQEAVRHWRLARPRSAPGEVAVHLFSLQIVSGTLQRRPVRVLTVPVPLLPRTEAEYEQDLQDIVGGLPAAFREYVRSEAWERGHSAGYDEVINIAAGLVSGLEAPIAAFRLSVIASAQ